MTDAPKTTPERDRLFAARIRAKARRKRQAQRNPTRAWLGLGMMGLIGWSVALPTVLGVALGVWLDARHPGTHSWTLALLVAGLALGCVNAWHWVAKEDKAIHDDTEGRDE